MAAKLDSPGITSYYKKAGVQSIVPAELGTVILLGVSEWGECNKPITIYSPADRKAKIGDYLAGYYGAKCVDAVFNEGAKQVIFVRCAHSISGVLQAAKAALTVQGCNAGAEDRTKVNTVTFTAKCEGTYGNRLKVNTVKASTTSAAILAASSVYSVTVNDSSDFEVGDVVDISDGTHYVRVVLTAVNPNTGTEKLYFEPVTLSSQIASGATVKTASTHIVRTQFATGQTLATNATSIELENVTGIKVGQILTFMDTQEDTNAQSITVEVTNIDGNTVEFASVGTITSILAVNSEVVSQEFNCRIYLNNDEVGTEQKFLSMSSNFESNYIDNKFDNDYLVAADQSSSEDAIGDIPIASVLEALTSGTDGLDSLADADFTGSSIYKTGLYALDSLASQFAQIACPDARSATVKKAVVNYAESKLWWTEQEPDFDKTPAEAVEFKNSTAMLNTDKGAMSYPNVKWLNPESGVTETIPASILVMGLNARIWTSVGKGPWIQPAGVEDGVLMTCEGLESEYTDDRTYRDLLSKNLLNSIYKFNPYGYVVYDINTLINGGDLTQKGESVTFLYCRHSIVNGIPWALFKNIDDAFKGRVYRTIRAFLRTVWRGGGLKGLTEEEAFEIDLTSLNTDETEAQGEFFAKIGLATKKGARKIYFEFSKKLS
jgi:phage tail sheath protein FI